MLRPSSTDPSVHAVLDDVLADLRAAGIDHALVRDPSRDGRGRFEVDLLVAPSDRTAAEAVLADHAFRRRPAGGRRPHRFHLRPVRGVDGALDWIKVDLVTDLSFGRWHELATGAARRCLTCPRPAAAHRLAPADELAALLLHGLLDRGRLDDRQRERLAALAPQATRPGALAAWCTPDGAGWPTWTDLVTAAAERDWRALEDARPVLRRRLAAGGRASTTVRAGLNRVARRGGSLVTAAADRGPLVALVGTDGSGKSTLAAALVAPGSLTGRTLYGGTYRSGTRAGRLPGATTARVAVRLLATRAAAAWHRARGRLVVLDRHPTEARPTPDDGLRLRARLRRRFLASLLPRPDLLLVLDAPVAVLHARRPEHDPAHLERDRRRHLALLDDGPEVVVLDASRPAAEVLDRAIEVVWDRAFAHHVGAPPTPAAVEPEGSAA